jgi:hypothetical protein
LDKRKIGVKTGNMGEIFWHVSSAKIAKKMASPTPGGHRTGIRDGGIYERER